MDAKGRVLSDECIADEVPFGELPEGWVWARLSSLFTKIGSGSTPAGGRKVYQDEGPMLIRSQNVHNEGLKLEDVAHFAYSLFKKRGSHVLPNDILLNITGASIGRCAIVPNPFEEADVNQHVLIMRPVDSTLNHYLHIAIVSPLIQAAIMAGQVGATKEGLSATKASNLIVPVPPLAEQYRVVERVNRLMPLVEEYGKLEDDREALDAALPERLRKSVLQMAVQGKLAPQDPSDEPASMLLERIRDQRRQLIAEKKMKAPKGGESVIFTGSDGRRYEKRVDAKGGESEPVCIEDEIPFEMPESWEWVRLSTVLQLSSGLGYKKDNLSVKGEHMVRVLRGGNIGEDDEPLIKDNDVLISAEFVDDSLLLRDGQIITPAVTSLENVGKAAIVRNADGETVCGGFVFYLTPYLKSICHSEYLHRYLASPGHIAFCKSVVKKSGQAFYNLSKASLNSALVAIPPLAEQHRIVERVNELMPLITNQ